MLSTAMTLPNIALTAAFARTIVSITTISTTRCITAKVIGEVPTVIAICIVTSSTMIDERTIQAKTLFTHAAGHGPTTLEAVGSIALIAGIAQETITTGKSPTFIALGVYPTFRRCVAELLHAKCALHKGMAFVASTACCFTARASEASNVALTKKFAGNEQIVHNRIWTKATNHVLFLGLH